MDVRRIKEFSNISSNLNLLTWACDRSGRKWYYPSRKLLELLGFSFKDFEENPEIWISRIPSDRRESILSRLNDPDRERDIHTMAIPLYIRGDRLASLEFTFYPQTDDVEEHYYICSAMDLTESENYKHEAIQSRDYEIEISARIQRALLTGAYNYKNDYLEICADTLPSKKVDGDFYEFISLSEGSMDFIVGDVMGKGVPAALLAAAMKNSFFRALINQAVQEKDIPSISGIIRAIDSQMAKELVALNKFLTLYYCRIDSVRSSLSFIDAGHTSMIYYSASDDTCWSVKGSNMPMGFLEKQDYRPYQLPLDKGDLLFFYSDGITEVENSEGVQFGNERLEQLLYAHRHMTPEKLIRKVINVTFFYAAQEFHDDVTVIASRIRKGIDSPTVRTFTPYEKAGDIDLEELKELLTGDILNVFADFDGDELARLLIAYIEAVTNCIKFSRGPLTPGWKITGDRLILTIDFLGSDFNWAFHKNPDVTTYQQSGFGLFLIDAAVDSYLLLKGSGDRKKFIMVREFKWE